MSLTPKEHAAVTQRLVTGYNTLAEAIHELTRMAAGGMLQLRCHERSIEDHDDVVKIMAADLGVTLSTLVKKLATLLDDANGWKDNNVNINVLDRMLACAYGKIIGEQLHRYDKAFKSEFAVVIIDMTVDNIKCSLDQVCRAMTALHVTGLYARSQNVIDNKSVAAVITDYISSAMAVVGTEIEATGDRANRDLDKIAAEEARYYHELKASGCSREEAWARISAKFDDVITELVLTAMKDETNHA